MNAPQSASDSAAVAPAQLVRLSLPTTAPFGADPRDKFITCFVDNRGAGPGEVARLYMPPAAPRGSDPRDRHITGGFMSGGRIAPTQPLHRRQFFRGYEIPEGEAVAMLAPMPLRFARVRVARLAACPINA